MKILLKSCVLTSSVLLMQPTQAMNTPEKKVLLEQLRSAVFDTFIIKEHIPGKLNLLSEAFRKFLVKPSLCDMFGQNINEDDNNINITSLSYSPQRTHILTWSGENAVIWNTGTGDLMHSFQNHKSIPSVNFSSDGTVEVPQSSEKTTNLSQNSSSQKFLTHANLNQIELLQAIELAIRDGGRIHLENDVKSTQIRQTFSTFPPSIQRKLRRFIAQEEIPDPQQTSSCSSTQIP